jgi:hypothetical protein
MHHKADKGQVACLPVKKKKQKPDTKEAVRRRLLRLRDSPDFKVLPTEELEKASGGGECKECTGYQVELRGVYKQNADLTRDYSLRMLEYMGARRDYESRIAGMQDDINSLVRSVKKQKLRLAFEMAFELVARVRRLAGPGVPLDEPNRDRDERSTRGLRFSRVP